MKSSGSLPLITFLLLLCACGGGGDGEEAKVTATEKGTSPAAAAPSEAISETVSPSEARLEETAQAEAEQYGLVAACLVEGDITEDGYDLAEIAGIFAPFGLGFDPAIGTVEFVAGVEVDGEVVSTSQTVVSIYDPNYQGTPVPLRRVSGEGKTCYVPTS